MNLDNMTVTQLRELRARIDNAIATKQAEAKAALRKQFAAMAEEIGSDLSDVVGGKRRARGAMAWRDPKTGVEWSGRGRRPKNFDQSRAIEL